jgi:hypothetical protein
MTPLSINEQATFISDALTGINDLFGRKIWTRDEISFVSEKITSNPLSNLNDIIKNAFTNPINRKRTPLMLTYSVTNYKSELNGNKYSTNLNGDDNEYIFSFVTETIKKNDSEGIPQYLHEQINIESKNNKDAENSLKAIGFYADNATDAISTVNYANYNVHSGRGLFAGATLLRIDFNNKDKSRIVTIIYEKPEVL